VEIDGCRIVVGKRNKKKRFKISGLRWKGAVQTDIKETGCGIFERIYLDQGSVS
jgi:hypothetical protein